MELDVWLVMNKMTIKELAQHLEVDRDHLGKIINKRVKPGKRLARDIVLATQGQVTERELMSIDNQKVA